MPKPCFQKRTSLCSPGQGDTLASNTTKQDEPTFKTHVIMTRFGSSDYLSLLSTYVLLRRDSLCISWITTHRQVPIAHIKRILM